MTVGTITPTSVSLTWTGAGSDVDSYAVLWRKDGVTKNATITDRSNRYTISGLEEDSSYVITVTATNAAGSAVSDPITALTPIEGAYHLSAHSY